MTPHTGHQVHLTIRRAGSHFVPEPPCSCPRAWVTLPEKREQLDAALKRRSNRSRRIKVLRKPIQLVQHGVGLSEKRKRE